ncbi:MAG TPA: hypothetical protein PLJ34_01465, partial [Hyphomicrobiales bacterium]|nr:hypothetical protein [Hyphomicrobiales bacterium]
EEGAVKSGSDTATFLYLYKNEGFARIKTVVGPREAVADVQTRLPDDVATTGTYRWYRGAWSDTDGWPALPVIAPCLGPRIWWFRNNELWFSVGYDWWDFEAGLGDDDGYGTSIGSPDGSLVEFRWAMADKVLVVGGKSNEWVARTQNAYDVATPNNVRMFNEEDKGSADHIPTRLSGGVAFLSRDRKDLYFCRVDMLAEKLAVQKLTRYYREALCSPGVGLAWQRAPNNLLFVPREDGQMLMVVLDEEQKVLAISRRITRGVIEAVCVSPSPDDAVDDVYLIVRRVIDGVTRRYLERVAPYFSASCSASNTAEGAVYFDAALTYEGPATMRLTGFDHLIGEEIGLLVNGKAHPRRIVDAEGGVDLAFEATSAVGGLPIDARLKSLPLETATDEGTTRFRNRKASRLVLDLFETLGGTVKVNDGRAFPIQTGGGRDPSAPPSLLDGQIGVGVEDDWRQTTQVEIEAGDGMPMTVRGFAVKAELGAR